MLDALFARLLGSHATDLPTDTHTVEPRLVEQANVFSDGSVLPSSIPSWARMGMGIWAWGAGEELDLAPGGRDFVHRK
eukprot:12161630-Alexandrium_andersonii.AAC.1